MSAESGIATFRDPGGVWAKYDLQDVATPQGFARDPAKVLEFYNMRRRRMRDVMPNAAHIALARLEWEFSGGFLLVTQNVGDSRTNLETDGRHFTAVLRCLARLKAPVFLFPAGHLRNKDHIPRPSRRRHFCSLYC
ncbi:Sir2 family NAD-dependent protein deacetylase [Mesorhizobium sp. PAMC28654]|uniref:Sir2 family NAD-dependent protein deacetylase n=1 Tax=Mesorhizobium sp. PAMC28654 TaxID=2880934 RepID=UPI0029CAAECB|nr:Sir2 family NAD-dependent protein deacetylase [Mesorhizobium sp. PAMC28654]